MPETVKCEKCKEPYSAAGMFFGTMPGATCKCGWMTMPDRDFKKMFGFSFNQVMKRNQIAELEKLPEDYDPSNCLLEPSYSGNSHQRRQQRKAFLRSIRTSHLPT